MVIRSGQLGELQSLKFSIFANIVVLAGPNLATKSGIMYHFWRTKIGQLYLCGVPRMVLLPLVYASNVHETHNRKDIATH